MSKVQKLIEEICAAKMLITANEAELDRIAMEKKQKKIQSQYKYMIVNGRLEETKGNLKLQLENGLPVGNDDYGMGSVNWSLVKTKEEAKDRQLIDNVIWAVRRLNWAATNAPNEIERLKGVILTGGKSRGGFDKL